MTADRRFAGIAPGLSDWIDSDAAMQLLGRALGVFGRDALAADSVLAAESPLRNALFDTLLSLVEGNLLEVRPLTDGRYEFRWRADAAEAAMGAETAPVDMDAPPAHLAALATAVGERDEARAQAVAATTRAEQAEAMLADQRSRTAEAATRAEVAEELAAERELREVDAVARAEIAEELAAERQVREVDAIARAEAAEARHEVQEQRLAAALGGRVELDPPSVPEATPPPAAPADVGADGNGHGATSAIVWFPIAEPSAPAKPRGRRRTRVRPAPAPEAAAEAAPADAAETGAGTDGAPASVSGLADWPFDADPAPKLRARKTRAKRATQES